MNENVFAYDFEIDGINTIKTGKSSQPETFYTIDGKKVISPQKGVYIVKKSDGAVRKVFVI